MARVLVPIEERMMDPSAAYPQFSRALWLALQVCEAHGYEVDVQTVGNLGVTYSSDDYDFAIVPRLKDQNSWGAGGSDLIQFYDGSWGKPCFVLSVLARFVDYILDNVKTEDAGTNSYTNGKVTWNNTTIYGSYVGHTITPGSDVDVFATETDTGDAVVWRVNNSNNSNVYCDASNVVNTQIYSFFPLMLQEAINNGDVAKPPRKARIAFDLDDFPDATNTIDDITSTHDVLSKHSIPATIGINPAIDSQIDDDIWPVVASRVSTNGGLYYPVNHNTTANFYTSASVATNLEGSGGIPYLTAKGLTPEDDYSQGGYLYFPNNNVDDDFMRLAQGYGVEVVRLDGLGAAAGRLFEPLGITSKQTYKFTRLVGSTSQLSTGDINIEVDSAAETLDFSIMFGDVLGRGAYGGQPLYLHGSNFYDGHSGGNAPGKRFLGIIGQLTDYCSDSIEWVHGQKLVNY